jgi:hypothetical protein
MNLVEDVDDRTHEIAVLHGKHVRALHIFLATRISTKEDSREDKRLNDINKKRVVDIISLCPETWYLALYHAPVETYSHSRNYAQRLIPISSIMQLEKLNTIGVHYLQKDHLWRIWQVDTICEHIQEIAESERVSRIKRLELSIPTLRVFLRDSLRTRFISLEHLSMHTSIMPFYRSEDVGPEELNWSAYRNLTTLQLSRRLDNRPYSFRIPEMVRKHPSLQELFVSDLAEESERMVEKRLEGWSYLPDQWWNERKPLRLLHVEAALNKTVQFLGLIPVESVRLVFHGTGVNLQFFMEDEEIFPHLKWLHVKKLALIGAIDPPGEEESTDHLSEVCNKRDIALTVAQ